MQVATTMRDNKVKFRKYLENTPNTPVYIQDWYLDVVCGKENWNVCVVEKGADVVGVLPYYIKQNKFFTWIAMPPLSKMHGPYIAEQYRNGKHHHQVVDELLEQLPKVDFYQQGLNYDFENWLPYLWKGYSQVTLYSYVFKTIEADNILAVMDSDCRRRIKKADEQLEIKFDLKIGEFHKLLGKTFERQNLKVPFEEPFLTDYYNEVRRRNAGNLLCITDKNGVVHSAALVIHDKQSAYYLLEATDPDAPNKHAAIFMKWKALLFTKEVLGLNRFDFEGSISRRIEKIYREFGAEAEPYFVIKKYHSRMFLGLKFVQNYRQYGKLVQW